MSVIPPTWQLFVVYTPRNWAICTDDRAKPPAVLSSQFRLPQRASSSVSPYRKPLSYLRMLPGMSLNLQQLPPSRVDCEWLILCLVIPVLLIAESILVGILAYRRGSRSR